MASQSGLTDDGGGVSDAQLRRIKELFTTFDQDGSGAIDKTELKYAMRSLKIAMPEKEFDAMFASIDTNGDGVIDFDEYVALMSGFVAANNREEELKAIFTLLIDKRTGKISQKTLKRASRDLGLPLTDAELVDMFDAANTSENGQISFEEFLDMAEKTGLF